MQLRPDQRRTQPTPSLPLVALVHVTTCLPPRAPAVEAHIRTVTKAQT